MACILYVSICYHINTFTCFSADLSFIYHLCICIVCLVVVNKDIYCESVRVHDIFYQSLGIIPSFLFVYFSNRTLVAVQRGEPYKCSASTLATRRKITINILYLNNQNINIFGIGRLLTT